MQYFIKIESLLLQDIFLTEISNQNPEQHSIIAQTVWGVCSHVAFCQLLLFAKTTGWAADPLWHFGL